MLQKFSQHLERKHLLLKGKQLVVSMQLISPLQKSNPFGLDKDLIIDLNYLTGCLVLLRCRI